MAPEAKSACLILLSEDAGDSGPRFRVTDNDFVDATV